MKAYVNEVSSKFSVLEIYGEKRSELNREVFEHIKNKFNEDGIIIESTNFSRIGLDPETTLAIQRRVNSQQELEREKIEKEKSKIEADRQMIIITGEANRKVVEAEAEAKKLILLAEAEAKSNELKKKSLTEELIEYEKINKWNGELPRVTGGSTPLLDFR